MNQIDLKGHRAIVTGAAQGIGKAIATRLLDSGARVALWDIDKETLGATAAELGAKGEATICVVDMTDWNMVERAMTWTVEAFGGIDIVVNNAGISGMTVPVEELPVEEWRRVVDLDLTGVFHGCKAAIAPMKASGYGRIVNIASVAGKEGNPNAAAYSAAKGGVIALTKSLGKELADHDIAVNCVTPAAARTAIFDQMTEDQVAYMLSKIPRGRFVTVDEIAAMVAWLASPENSFTTGGVFDISGGRATY